MKKNQKMSKNGNCPLIKTLKIVYCVYQVQHWGKVNKSSMPSPEGGLDPPERNEPCIGRTHSFLFGVCYNKKTISLRPQPPSKKCWLRQCACSTWIDKRYPVDQLGLFWEVLFVIFSKHRLETWKCWKINQDISPLVAKGKQESENRWS